MKKMRIEFEKGGSFIVNLLEDQAPQSVKAVWSMLPLEGKPFHMRWAGRGLTFKLQNLPEPYPPRENQISIVGEGYLMFRAPWVPGYGPDPSIILFYGPEIPRNPGDIYGVRLNLIGRIRENLEELEKVGERFYWEGRETVVYDKAQE